jgi:ribosome biogenesis GTPase / thiamine phosphate phosphatase
MAKVYRDRKFDEDDVRVRPSRSTRPRSKERPKYSDAQDALVISVDRGRITALLQSDMPATGAQTLLTAVTARELGRKSAVVGDHVKVVGDLTGNPGTLARIVKINERKNSLSRTVDDDPSQERRLVANIDQLAIVAACANPEPRHGFIDRALVIAFDQRITPIIVMTKRDLADPSEFLENYRTLDIPIFEIQRGDNLDQLTEILQGRMTVLLGHSGVGKSTLVNALTEEEQRATGSVNEVTGRGRHTSSNAIALLLPGGGFVIDTPGVRSFGLSHIDRSRVIGAFPEFAEIVARCPKNCSHMEETCALNHSSGLEGRSERRLESLRSLLTSSTGSEY